jgi:hypothetical protein
MRAENDRGNSKDWRPARLMAGTGRRVANPLWLLLRNAICFAATDDFKVLRHAVIPSHRFSAHASGRNGRNSPAQTQRGNNLYEHHHGHDERAEART